jgi:hypothetical protein
MPDLNTQPQNTPGISNIPSRPPLPEKLQPTEQQSAGRALNLAQNNARRWDTRQGAKQMGDRMQTAGRSAQTAGKGMQAAGKGMQAAGKGLQAGGQSMMSAGAGLSSTGLGAIAGVPLMAAGALTTGVGVGTQAAGAGAQAAGKGAETAGKGAQAAGKNTQQAGKQIKGLGQQLSSLGPSPKPPIQGMVPKGQEAATKRILEQNKLQAAKSAIKQPVQFAKDIVGEIGKKGTAEALKQSWLNLIDSWGLTFLYIDLHFIGKYIAHSRFFCDFGEEWTSSISSPGGAGQIASMAGGSQGAEQQQQMIPRGRGLMIAELILVIVLNIILFGLIVLIIIAILAPVVAVNNAWQVVWDVIKSAAETAVKTITD